MKKFDFKSYFAGIITVILIMTSIVSIGALSEKINLSVIYDNYKVNYNGKVIDTKLSDGEKAEPFMYNNHLYVAAESFAKAIDYNIRWDEKAKTLFVEKSSLEEEKAKVVLKTKEDIEAYLKKYYSKIPSSIVDLPEVKFNVLLNESISIPYDFRINVLWWTYNAEIKSLYGVYNEVKNSINYTKEQKDILEEELSAYQETLAKDLISKLPEKKLTGGFYYGFYKYKYVQKGFQTVEKDTWVNYTIKSLPNYENSPISTFQWK